jgi:type IV secretory pathway TraG/TraD family ATPase VirD4
LERRCRVSRLVGEHDVRTTSTSRGRNGATRSTSTRRDRILSPAAIRALPKGRALLLATGSRPALLRLQPWYAGTRAAQVRAASTAATADIAQRAAEE